MPFPKVHSHLPQRNLTSEWLMESVWFLGKLCKVHWVLGVRKGPLMGGDSHLSWTQWVPATLGTSCSPGGHTCCHGNQRTVSSWRRCIKGDPLCEVALPAWEVWGPTTQAWHWPSPWPLSPTRSLLSLPSTSSLVHGVYVLEPRRPGAVRRSFSVRSDTFSPPFPGRPSPAWKKTS